MSKYRLSIYIEPDLERELRAVATSERRTLTSVINRALELELLRSQDRAACDPRRKRPARRGGKHS